MRCVQVGRASRTQHATYGGSHRADKLAQQLRGRHDRVQMGVELVETGMNPTEYVSCQAFKLLAEIDKNEREARAIFKANQEHVSSMDVDTQALLVEAAKNHHAIQALVDEAEATQIRVETILNGGILGEGAKRHLIGVGAELATTAHTLTQNINEIYTGVTGRKAAPTQQSEKKKTSKRRDSAESEDVVVDVGALSPAAQFQSIAEQMTANEKQFLSLLNENGDSGEMSQAVENSEKMLEAASTASHLSQCLGTAESSPEVLFQMLLQDLIANEEEIVNKLDDSNDAAIAQAHLESLKALAHVASHNASAMSRSLEAPQYRFHSVLSHLSANETKMLSVVAGSSGVDAEVVEQLEEMHKQFSNLVGTLEYNARAASGMKKQRSATAIDQDNSTTSVAVGSSPATQAQLSGHLKALLDTVVNNETAVVSSLKSSINDPQQNVVLGLPEAQSFYSAREQLLCNVSSIRERLDVLLHNNQVLASHMDTHVVRAFTNLSASQTKVRKAIGGGKLAANEVVELLHAHQSTLASAIRSLEEQAQKTAFGA